MKTSVCLVVLTALVALCFLSVEGSHAGCTKPCERIFLVRRYVLYRWGSWSWYYPTYVYEVRNTTCPTPCPIDCEWGEWTPKGDGEWSTCSVTCGNGTESRPMTRSPKQVALYGGKPCEGVDEKYEYQGCAMLDCPHTICAKNGNGHYAHLQKCSKFVQCENKKAHVKACPVGTAWDRKGDKKCSSEALGQCQGVACMRGMHYPDNNDCSKYYICDHNKFIPKQCEGNMYWDISVNGCTPDKAVCDKIRQARSKTPRVLTCNKEDEGNRIASDDDCNKYYVCTSGILKEMVCAEGTKFDRKSTECLHARDVSCIDDPEEKEAEKCKVGDFIGNKQNRNMYYVCGPGGKLLDMKCGDGLVFDTKLKVCNWPL